MYYRELLKSNLQILSALERGTLKPNTFTFFHGVFCHVISCTIEVNRYTSPVVLFSIQ